MMCLNFINGSIKWWNLTLLYCVVIFVPLISIRFCKSFPTTKCLVCHHVVDHIIWSIKNEDPKKKIEVGSFRIQPDGSQKKTEIKYAGSESHIHEILESVCDMMSDFAQAKHKETGEMALLNLSKDVEKLSTYELVPDTDLNRSLKYNCESLVEEYEDDILEELNQFSTSKFDVISHICETKAGYCKKISEKTRKEL